MTKLTRKQESLLNELLEDFKGDPEAVMGRHGLMNQLRKRVVEAMLDGELTSHLVILVRSLPGQLEIGVCRLGQDL